MATHFGNDDQHHELILNADNLKISEGAVTMEMHKFGLVDQQSKILELCGGCDFDADYEYKSERSKK